MLSEARHSTRSPSESVQTDSVRTGPTTGASGRLSRRSSITEEEDSHVPLPPPPPPIIHSKKKSSSSSSSTTSSSLTESSPKATTGSTNAAKNSNDTTFQRSTLRHVSSDEKKTYGGRIPNQTTKSSESKQKTSGTSNRVNIRDITDEIPTLAYTPRGRDEKTNQSVFEKVDTRNGHTTYLGTGTYSQLENCISNCLLQSRSHVDNTNHGRKHHSSHRSLAHASVLEDYSYDGIIAPKYQTVLPSSSHHHHSNHHYYDDYHYSDHHHSDHHHHHHHADHRKSAAELSLIEIREVNDALAKYGIPVFSHHANPPNPHQGPHSVNEIVSACQLLINEPRLGLHGDGHHAVQHVWDNIQHHQPSTNIHGYASPAVRGVVSHLFNPNHQTPYDPVHGVASHLFGPPQQNSYYPGQGPPSPPFGQPPQNSYYPGQSPPPPPFGQPPQNSYNPGQSAISRLFGSSQQNSYNPGQGPPQQPAGSPFGNSFHQYPGNNHY